MKVLHLSSNRWNSAITEYALSSARGLVLAGHESLFVSLRGSPAESRAQTYGIWLESLRSFLLQDGLRLWRIIKERRPDVIFCYGGRETSLLQLVRPLLGFHPLVFRFRGQDFRADSASKLKHRLSHLGVNALVVPASWLREKLTFAEPCRTIVLGVDSDRFYRRPLAGTSRPTLLIFGRFDPVKGHAAAIATFKQVLCRWENSGLTERFGRPLLQIVGNPENVTAADLAAWVKAQNLVATDVVADAKETGRAGGKASATAGAYFDVLIEGRRVDNAADYLQRAHLGWISSLGSEVIVRVAQEFLLVGTPIVVSGVGSLDEVMFAGAGASYREKSQDEAAGLICAQLLSALVEGEEAKIARAKQAKNLYSLEVMGQALVRLIDEFRA